MIQTLSIPSMHGSYILCFSINRETIIKKRTTNNPSKLQNFLIPQYSASTAQPSSGVVVQFFRFSLAIRACSGSIRQGLKFSLQLKHEIMEVTTFVSPPQLSSLTYPLCFVKFISKFLSLWHIWGFCSLIKSLITFCSIFALFITFPLKLINVVV